MLALIFFIHASSPVWEVNLNDFEMYQPGYVAVADSGTVCVADQIGCRLLLFSGNGKFIKAVGRKGEGPGEFQTIRRIFWDQTQNVFLAIDTSLGRVTVLKGQDFVKEVKIPHEGLFQYVNDDFLAKNELYAKKLDPQDAKVYRIPLGSEETEILFEFPNHDFPGGSFKMNGRTMNYSYKWHSSLMVQFGTKSFAITDTATTKVDLISLLPNTPPMSMEITFPRIEVTEKDSEVALSTMPPTFRSSLATQLKPPKYWPLVAGLFFAENDKFYMCGQPKEGKSHIAALLPSGQFAYGTVPGIPSVIRNGYGYYLAERNDKLVLFKEGLPKASLTNKTL